ncbi:hypothetical protein ACQJBY_060903 [Aegilops geniculata]
MAKRLFHSCRSPSAAAVVTPATSLLAKHHSPAFTPPAGGCCPRGLTHRRSLPPETCSARGCAADYTADDLPPARGTPAYRWLKSSHWHVIEAATDGDDTPRLKIDARRRLRRSRRRRRLHRKAAIESLSSGDSGWFSSSEEPSAYSSRSVEAEATLVTSTATETSSGVSGSSGAVAAAAAAEAVVAGSFAVVKRSDDPRADFRRSMAEMVVGRGIYDADGLERLLRCFLALNDQRHRRDIVEAFGDVWEAVFSSPLPHGAVTSAPAASCRAAAAGASRQ